MSKSTGADAEGASSSSKEEIIRGLNEDLAREVQGNNSVCCIQFHVEGRRVWRHCRTIESACF